MTKEMNIRIYATIPLIFTWYNEPMNIQFDKKLLGEIRKKHNLSLIVLHGSYVNGKVHPQSDFDIAVLRNDRKKKLKLLDLIKDLVGIFNKDIIDITDLTNADPLLLYATTKKSKLLSGSKSRYDALIKLAFHKYCDYLPFLDQEKKFVKERIGSYVTA